MGYPLQCILGKTLKVNEGVYNGTTLNLELSTIKIDIVGKDYCFTVWCGNYVKGIITMNGNLMKPKEPNKSFTSTLKMLNDHTETFLYAITSPFYDGTIDIVSENEVVLTSSTSKIKCSF